MTVLTQEEFDRFSALANEIKDETKKANALGLLQRMTEVIEGGGDRVITWNPTQVKILQALSNMDNIQGDGKKNPSAGDLVAGGRVLPNGTKVIPLMFYSSRSLWDPNKDNPVKLCNSPDAKSGWKYGDCKACAFGNSKEEGKAPPCNKEQTFLVVAEDLSDVYRVTFAKSQYRSGMDWGKEITASRTHPYKRTYSLHGEALEKNKKIKVIKAKLEDVRQTVATPDVMPFLEALHRKNVDDRKAYLEAYHEATEKRLIDMQEERPALEHQEAETEEAVTVDNSAPAYRL